MENNTLIISFQRDLLGRITEECNRDMSCQVHYLINYGYDEDGNQNSITRSVDENIAKETLAYDSFGRLTEKKDALGHTTKVLYNENFINPLGQKVLQTITISPENIHTIEINDPYGKVVKKDIVSKEKG